MAIMKCYGYPLGTSYAIYFKNVKLWNIENEIYRTLINADFIIKRLELGRTYNHKSTRYTAHLMKLINLPKDVIRSLGFRPLFALKLTVIKRPVDEKEFDEMREQIYGQLKGL